MISVLSLLTHYHAMPHFDTLKIYITVENIVRKGEMACNKRFRLCSQCFLHYMTLILHFKCTLKLSSARPMTYSNDFEEEGPCKLCGNRCW